MAPEMHDRVKAIFAAVDGKDVEGLSALLTEDVAFRFGNAETIHGRAAVEESSRTYNATVGGVTHHVVDLWQPEPDVAVVVLEIDYRRTDGGELRLPCCNVLRFRDDLVADFRIYMDIGPVFAPARAHPRA